MIQHGTPPYKECSSRGDKRFSAFYTRLRWHGGKSIEEIYQAAKKFCVNGVVVSGLSWREAKGREAINQKEVAALYSDLWDDYIAENPDLLPVLREASGLQDIFGQEGHVCQATELWRIRNAQG
jgi:hypothetical protein